MSSELGLDPVASDFLDDLHRLHSSAADRVEDALDALEADPGAAEHRRHRLVLPGDGRTVWGFVASGHMILWRETDQAPHVLHINTIF
ncbi:MAG: hypothetical protein FWH11_09580 [Micrococcales bacterium]|nr:hypothetical protein [Micrococcales bacterium]